MCRASEMLLLSGLLVLSQGVALLNASLYSRNLHKAYNPLEELGKTTVLLDGECTSCRKQECNMGNLVADAIIDFNAKGYTGGEGWTDAAIALINAGAIKESIEKPRGQKILIEDIAKALPEQDVLVKVTLAGSDLRKMMEQSMISFKENGHYAYLSGAFLQVSGLQVIYDLSKPVGHRVSSLKVRCAACREPSWSDLDDNKSYTILTTEFLANGGDGYIMPENLKHDLLEPKPVTIIDALAEYLVSRGTIHPGVEWRIGYLLRVNGEERVCSELVTEHEFARGFTTATYPLDSFAMTSKSP